VAVLGLRVSFRPLSFDPIVSLPFYVMFPFCPMPMRMEMLL
jgi:hypothetical protein